MEEHLGFAASLAQLLHLSGKAVIKGRDYLKAVHDREPDARRLINECNVLTEVLRSLGQVVKGFNSELMASQNVPTPNYINIVIDTLTGINDILQSFDENVKAVLGVSDIGFSECSPSSLEKQMISKVPAFNNLKWPWEKSKIEASLQILERLKTSCLLALAVRGLTTGEQVLETMISQQKQLEIIESLSKKVHGTFDQEEKVKMIRWFSPVKPAEKQQDFQSSCIKGTGQWIFNEASYKTWLLSKNSGLFIWGIAGAGKTIISSIIVRKLSTLDNCALAYFYCRNNDPESQNPVNILGSLISQSASRNQDAQIDATDFYERHKEPHSPRPTVEQLGELLQRISTRFQDGLTIVIDGLDECGNSNKRERLLNVLSTLIDPTAGFIRLAVFSRKESDIQDCLSNFDSLCISASPEDLRQLVNSKLPSLNIRSTALSRKVVNKLVNQAEGMFLLTKCQLDYLSLLPNDEEKERALRSLPPTLHEMYAAILERIDASYPEPTKVIIQRIFTWLAMPSISGDPGVLEIRHAISVEQGSDSLKGIQERMPSIENILKWCSTFITLKDDRLNFSHFTVKEFLTTEESKTQSLIARKYLVNRGNWRYLIETCLSYMSLPEIVSVESSDQGQLSNPRVWWGSFRRDFPFYFRACCTLRICQGYFPSDQAESPPLLRFFSSRNSLAVQLWNRVLDACIQPQIGGPGNYTPLQIASSLLLDKTTQRLLSYIPDPDEERSHISRSPLHYAIIPDSNSQIFQIIRSVSSDLELRTRNLRQLRMSLVRTLIRNKVDINCPAWAFCRQHTVPVRSPPGPMPFSPLCLAIICGQDHIAKLLLDSGVSLRPNEGGLGVKFGNWAFLSQNGFFQTSPNMKAVYDMILDLQKDPRLLQASSFDKAYSGISLGTMKSDGIPAGWAVVLGIQGEGQWDHYTESHSSESLVYAVRLHHWKIAKRLRTDGADIHASYPQGTTVLVRVLEYHFEVADYIFGPIEDLYLSFSELVYVLQCPFLSEIWLDTELLPILERSVEKFERSALKAQVADFSASISPTRTNSIEFALKYQLLAVAAKSALLSTACKLGEERYDQSSLNDGALEPSSTLDSVEALLQDQADPNIVGEDLMGPLHHACQRGLYHHVSSLLNGGAEVILAGPDQFQPIHFITKGSSNAGLDVSIANLLVGNGADLTAQTADGSNALSLAAGSGNLEMVQYLLSKSPSLANKDGDYPLHIACLHGFESIVAALLDANSNSDIIDSISPCHGSPLYIAAEHGYLDISKSLIDAGADVDLASSHHDSLGPPLFAACAKGHGEVVKLLLLHEAETTTEIKGLRFNSAIKVCEAFSQLNMKWILRHPSTLRR